MADLTEFFPKEKQGGYRPTGNGAPPKLVVNKTSVQKPDRLRAAVPPPAQQENLSSRVGRLTNQAGMSDDEPIKLILDAVSKDVDRFHEKFDELNNLIEKNVKNNQEEIAAATHRAVSRGMQNLTWQLGLWRWAVVGLSCAVLSFSSYQIGRNSRIETDIGNITPQVAEIMRMQNLPEQLTACRNQAPFNGIEWCLMPIIKKYPKLPN